MIDLKYIILFIVMVFMGAEAMIAAGSLVHFRVFELWPVFVLTFLGMYISDFVLYLIGFKFGEDFVKKFGKFIFLSQERFDKIKTAFDKRQIWVIFVSKFVYCVGHFASIIAGAAKMRPKRYAFYLFSSTLLSVGFFLGLGYFFFEFVDSITKDFKIIGLSVIGLIVLFAFGEKLAITFFNKKFLNKAKNAVMEKINGFVEEMKSEETNKN